MAENKKSFILYSDLLPTIRKLIEKDRTNGTNNSGELFYHILMYVSDENPTAINDLVDLMFEPIKTTLKRDLEKWETKADKSRQNGKLGGRPKNQQEPNLTQKTQQVILKPKKPVNVNDNVSDTVSENDNVLLEKETKQKKFIFKNALIDYGFKKELVDDWLMVREKKKSANTKTAFNGFISEIEKRSSDINEVLSVIVQNSWSGFKWSWYDNLKNDKNGKEGQYFKTVSNEFAEKIERRLQPNKLP